MQEFYSSSPSANRSTTNFNLKYEEIYRRCKAIAIRWSMIPPALEDKDLVQEALIKLWLAMPTFDETQPFSSFVNAIARNAFRDACRRYGRGEQVRIDSVSSTVGAFLQPEIDAGTVSIKIGLDRLTPRQRQVLEMHYGISDSGKASMDDIADELGVSRQTVYREEKRALHVLGEQTRRRKVTGILSL